MSNTPTRLITHHTLSTLHNSLHFLLLANHTSKSTLHRRQPTFHSTQQSPATIQLPQYTTRSTPHPVTYAPATVAPLSLHAVRCTLRKHSPQSIIHTAHSTQHTTQHTTHNTQHTTHSALNTTHYKNQFRRGSIQCCHSTL
jgi:hypothetical protein